MSNTVMTNTCIQWDTRTKDYGVFISGQYVGSRKRHDEATVLRNEEALKLARTDRTAERIRREAELFGGCRVCGFDHPAYRCPEVAAERRRQEEAQS